ncbi:MAG TPA: hypothetical protein VFX44_07770 [Solirubrobacterales bacterium]|jgi:hypothetical protein|nr:hypothetical protein [Solirubrobacterales bacterium]
MTVVKITPEEMESLGNRLSGDPAVAKLYELIKKEAEEIGGDTLRAWQLHLGKIWGRPYVMTLDEVASRLRMPVSRVTGLIQEVQDVVRPKWLATPEYKASRFAR